MLCVSAYPNARSPASSATLVNPRYPCSIHSKRTAQIKNTYKRDCLTLTADVDYVPSGTTLHGSAVVGHLGWLAGYQMSFDATKAAILKNHFAFGYKTSEFSLHSSIADGNEINGSVYHKSSDKLETGVQLNWNNGNESSTKFAMACKYKPDCHSVVRAKLDNNSCLGLSYQTELSDRVKLTASTLLDGKSTHDHKLGFGFEFEA